MPETADEKHFREICTQLTALSVALEAAERAFDEYRSTRPKVTFSPLGIVAHSDSTRDELENRVLALQRERHSLLPMYAELKFKMLGWAT